MLRCGECRGDRRVRGEWMRSLGFDETGISSGGVESGEVAKGADYGKKVDMWNDVAHRSKGAQHGSGVAAGTRSTKGKSAKGKGVMQQVVVPEEPDDLCGEMEVAQLVERFAKGDDFVGLEDR